ncbi:MAG: helix-turn-helix domain-containing protein [Pseudomonadota bacterium]
MAEPEPNRTFAEAKIETIRNADLVEVRRTQILDASLHLFLKKGYASTTIRDIASASGVNQASLYDYVANKEDILHRLLNRVWRVGNECGLERLASAVQAGAPLRPTLKAYFREHWAEMSQVILLAYRSGAYLSAADRKVLRDNEQASLTLMEKILRTLTGVEGQDQKVRISANLILYLLGFAPMRHWVMNDFDSELASEAAADAAVGAVEGLRASAPCIR